MENKPSIFDINFKDHIIWQFAFELCEEIAISVKDELMEMAPSIYEENPYGLTSVWDEICVEIWTYDISDPVKDPFTHYTWDTCEYIIKKSIRSKVNELKSEKQLALYWITPDIDRFPEETTDLSEADIDIDSIIELIYRDYVYNLAYDYETESIYNARCGIEEDSEFFEEE